MSRLVPAWPVPALDPARLYAGLPIRAVDWATLAGESNTAWYADGLGAVHSGMWSPDILTSGYYHLRVPVASTAHARIRVHAWGVGGHVRVVGLGAADVALPGAMGFATGAVVDASAAVAVDALAGRYLDLTLEADGVTVLRSVHVELLGAAGAGWPSALTTLGAGPQVDGIIPADTDEHAGDLFLSADLLIDRVAQWDIMRERRRLGLSWATWDDVVPSPGRVRGVLRVPSGGRQRVTLAAYVRAASTPTGATVQLYAANAGSRHDDLLVEVSRAAIHGEGWVMTTVDASVSRRSWQAPPQGIDGMLEVVASREGVTTPDDFDPTLPAPVGDDRGLLPTTDDVLAIAAWVG